jgi:proline-specific peptidase
VWYRIVGSGNGIPLLTLHGGPGAGHDYLEPLEALAPDRPVVFYDQLGCARSEQPADRSLWRIERFVAEVGAVRQSLDLERVHLLGQSWGGWLALEYMMTRPQGLASLTLASTSASIPQFVREAARLKAALPAEIRDTLQRYELAGDLQHPDYQAAVLEFYKRHLCRLDPWPDALLRSVKNIEGNPAYETMNGPNEFTVIGNLKDWDRTASLERIKIPTLITVGRYDEITPNCALTLHEGIPGSELHIFERSSHTAHLEEPEEYIRVVRDFLNRVEHPAG